MIDAISAIHSTMPAVPQSMVPSRKEGAEGGFADMLSRAIGEVERSQGRAAQATDNFLTGKGEELHSAALAVQRADLEFQLFLQVRNKVIGAYHEIMQAQV